MTAITDPAAATTADGTAEATVDGRITRLNPTDGLFLRAEHLAQIQTYASTLTSAVGLAAGSGVVHGYGVTLANNEKGYELQVTAGLAIDPTGRPLRSLQTAAVSLVDLTNASNRFWVVEVTAAAPRPFGDESVFGNLCDDPCSPATIHPWIAEGTTIRVRPDTMPDLDGASIPADRRNRLASKYFEREREGGFPWLVPSADSGPVGSILDRDWSAATPAPAGDAVPIALLLQVGDQWVLDVWAGRRDLDGAPARPAWQWRLGMRPWPVFLAQVLQFQDQLAQSWRVTHPATSAAEGEDPGRLIQDVLDRYQKAPRKSKLLDDAVTALRDSMRPVAASAGAPHTLPAGGIWELPPAGFLPAIVQGDAPRLHQYYTHLLGGNVDVRICHCRADHVPQALKRAQHLDRIPLDEAQEHPLVDVLIPDIPTDLPALRTDDYGWVAFVRRSEANCDRTTDKVEVFFVEGRIDRILGIPEYQPESPPVGTLVYPAGSWAYPGGDVSNKLAEHWPQPDELGKREIGLIALTTEARRPLGALRAALLGASFDSGIGVPPVYALASTGAREAIVVVLPPQPEA